MNKLLSAHFARLKKDKCFRVCTLLLIFLAVYRNIDSYLAMKEYDSLHSTLESTFFTYVAIVPILFPVFTSLFLGTEFSDGTIRNKLIIGHSRCSVYLSDLVVCILTGLFLCLIYMVFSFCTGVPLLGFFSKVIPYRVITATIGCSFVLIAAFAAIHTFVAMLNQNRAVTAVICILSTYLLLTIGVYINARLNEPEIWASYNYISDTGERIQQSAEPNPYYVGGAKRDVYIFLDEFLPGGQTMSLSNLTALHPSRLALYSGFITIVFTGFGIYFFKKKDIK